MPEKPKVVIHRELAYKYSTNKVFKFICRCLVGDFIVKEGGQLEVQLSHGNKTFFVPLFKNGSIEEYRKK